jgi:hypothetical protein
MAVSFGALRLPTDERQRRTRAGLYGHIIDLLTLGAVGTIMNPRGLCVMF